MGELEREKQLIVHNLGPRGGGGGGGCSMVWADRDLVSYASSSCLIVGAIIPPSLSFIPCE